MLDVDIKLFIVGRLFGVYEEQEKRRGENYYIIVVDILWVFRKKQNVSIEQEKLIIF